MIIIILYCFVEYVKQCTPSSPSYNLLISNSYTKSTHCSKHLQISGIDETLPQIIWVSLQVCPHICSPSPLSNVVHDSLAKAYYFGGRGVG